MQSFPLKEKNNIHKIWEIRFKYNVKILPEELYYEQKHVPSFKWKSYALSVKYIRFKAKKN